MSPGVSGATVNFEVTLYASDDTTNVIEIIRSGAITITDYTYPHDLYIDMTKNGDYYERRGRAGEVGPLNIFYIPSTEVSHNSKILLRMPEGFDVANKNLKCYVT
jgi:hypothetical protein